MCSWASAGSEACRHMAVAAICVVESRRRGFRVAASLLHVAAAVPPQRRGSLNGQRRRCHDLVARASLRRRILAWLALGSGFPFLPSGMPALQSCLPAIVKDRDCCDILRVSVDTSRAEIKRPSQGESGASGQESLEPMALNLQLCQENGVYVYNLDILKDDACILLPSTSKEQTIIPPVVFGLCVELRNMQRWVRRYVDKSLSHLHGLSLGPRATFVPILFDLILDENDLCRPCLASELLLM